LTIKHHLHISNKLTFHLQEVSLLYTQNVLFVTHLRWLAAGTIRLELVLSYKVNLWSPYEDGKLL